MKRTSQTEEILTSLGPQAQFYTAKYPGARFAREARAGAEPPLYGQACGLRPRVTRAAGRTVLASLAWVQYVYTLDPRERSEHCSPRALSRARSARMIPRREAVVPDGGCCEGDADRSACLRVRKRAPNNYNHR